jgi:hypothetical protein
MKFRFLIILILFLSSGHSQTQFGIDFTVGSSNFVGPNIRFSHLYELKPLFAISIIDNKSDAIGIIINNNFYLKDIGRLQNYIGFAIGYINSMDDFIVVNNGAMLIGGQYGLRCNLNEIVSIFGEIGVVSSIDPFFMTTAKSGLGVTFYFPNGS